MPDLRNMCARQLMETAPRILQSIRVEMRSGRGAEISIPQFRTLRFIQQHPDSSLSSLAENLGLMLPSVSKLVDGLVKADLVLRSESPVDRRKLTLELTATGEEIVNTARAAAQASLEAALVHLRDQELEIVYQAMDLLHPIFASQAKSP